MGAMNKKVMVILILQRQTKWRASLDILDFMPLTSADYGGGLIITDWIVTETMLLTQLKYQLDFYQMKLELMLLYKVFSKQCEKTINCKVSQSNPEIEMN